MAQLLGASSSKKRRAGEEGEVSEAAAMTAQEEDRISALPEDLRLRILALLPLKSAIRTGALSTRWRALWDVGNNPTLRVVGGQARFIW